MTTSWYGWQNMIVGHASLAVAAANLAGRTDPVWTLVPLSGYALGGPLVHLMHDHPIRAGVSFASNVGIPALRGLIGSKMAAGCHSDTTLFGTPNTDPRPGGWCQMGAMFTGILVGAIVAPIVDGLSLGWERTPNERSPAVSAKLQWQPTFSMVPKDARGGSLTTVGIAGAF
ncbi:MAG: hypothetical protein NVS3B20_10420 [Polyangiales bacterium]